MGTKTSQSLNVLTLLLLLVIPMRSHPLAWGLHKSVNGRRILSRYQLVTSQSLLVTDQIPKYTGYKSDLLYLGENMNCTKV